MADLHSSQPLFSSAPRQLNFSPVEVPAWHKADSLPEMSTMLGQIEKWQASASSWTARQVEFVQGTFSRCQAVEFVLLSNRMEQEGTQDAASTEALVRAAIGNPSIDKKTLSNKERTTVQTYEAMDWLYQRRLEMAREVADGQQYTILTLTPDLIKGAHKKLMGDLIDNPGEYRTNSAYPQGSNNTYLAPHLIEARLEGLLDTYADILNGLNELTCGTIFKLASYFLYHFLTIHPFSDGNGRLARILVNSILFLHVPFPVPLGPRTTHSATTWNFIDDCRIHYINAIEECRADKEVQNSPHRPRALASLIVQSVWHGWKWLNSSLVSHAADHIQKNEQS